MLAQRAPQYSADGTQAPQDGVRSASQMREGPQELEIEHRRATRPRLIVGLGLAALAGLIWFGTLTLVNWLVSLALMTIAAALVITGRARRIRIRFDVARATIESTPGGRRIEQVDHVELRAQSGELEGLPRPSFAAIAVTSDGRRAEIYETAAPSELLRWGRVLDAALPVRLAWAPGQPRVGEWLERPRKRASGSPPAAVPRRIQGRPDASQKKVSQLLFGIAGALGAAWALFLLGSDAKPEPLSVALAIGSVLFILLTAALVATDRTVVELGPMLIVERRRLGLRVQRLDVPLGEIRRAEPLTPDGEGGFLLLVTDRDILGVPLAQPATGQVAGALQASLGSSSTS